MYVETNYFRKPLAFKFTRGTFKHIASLSITLIAIHYCTIEHPFLLSDNRHYSFYVWRYFYRGHWILKYLYAPFYLLAFNLLKSCIRKFDQLSKLVQKIHSLWMIIYSLAVFFCLVTTPLLEFRYFIIPFIMLRLHSNAKNKLYIVKELILGLVVNLFTFYMFLYRPFFNRNNASVERFMW
ncbi:hypothetical protein ROZALSC1DRAFT_23054 [Rozella allomycis CSF55]|nr:hypothetical protein ROZALSC1DRAFT_23054 [Rozella allomycis CSF55]